MTEKQNQAPQVMKKALMCKFKQTPLKAALLQTSNVIGEATRNNKWGIGHTINSFDAFNKVNWSGNNAMGLLLLEIKQNLQ